MLRAVDEDDLLDLLEAREEPSAWSAGPAIVCRCNAVEEREIERLLDGGASVEEITRCTGAGATCSSCLPLLRRLASLRGS
jgi:NAD(P)H-nitrite reductase large subunit